MQFSRSRHQVPLAEHFLFFVLSLGVCALRLNAGTVSYAGKADPAYKTNLASDAGRVRAVKVLSNGKVLAGGNFGSLVSLNANGGGDSSFLASTLSVNGTFNYYEFNAVPVCAVVTQADGSIVLGGSVRRYGSQDTTNLVRIKANGTLDTAFLTAGQYSGFEGTPKFHNIPTGPDNTVLALAVQPDGKLLLAGAFTSINGQPNLNGIGRLNPDGTLDLDFVPGGGVDDGVESAIYTLALLPNGQMVVGGSFAKFNGETRGGIALLNQNGDVNLNFKTGSGVNTAAGAKVLSVAVQSDGRIVLGGNFTSINGYARGGIARLHSFGPVDADYATGSGFNGAVNSVGIQSDGKTVAGGAFTLVNGVTRKGIARLNTDGSTDTSFVPSSAIAGVVSSVTLQSNGKIVVGGLFAPTTGVAAHSLIRLNADGSLDTTFAPRNATDTPSIQALAPQSDVKKIYVAGSFASAEFATATSVARLHFDGSYDVGFQFDSGGVGQAVVSTSNHGVLAAITRDNDLSSYPGDDEDQAPDTGAVTHVRSPVVNPVRMRDDGTYDQTPLGKHGEVVLLKSDGAVNTSFTPLTTEGDKPFEDDGLVAALAVQSDGKVLVGGRFNSLHSSIATAATKLARFNANGSRDGAFTPPSEFGTSGIYEVFALAVQPADGKILAAATLSDKSAEVVRLAPAGSKDTAFKAVTASGGDIVTLALQADGKILVGGAFRSVNAVSHPVLVRLNADGSIDTGFAPGSFAAASGVAVRVNSIGVQADKKVLVAGVFESIGSVARHNLARLNVNGSLDTSFDPADGADGAIHALLVDVDGSIVTGGDFASVNGARHAGVARVRNPSVLPPVIRLPGTLTANVGKVFSYQVTATNNPTTYGSELSVPGLAFKNGLISGTPTKEGTYSIPVAVANAGGNDLETLTLVVRGPLPVITSSLNPASRQGVSLAYQITATNSPTAFSNTLSVPGLSFDSNAGRITGTPTKADTYKGLIGAANKNGSTTATLTLVVKQATPVITSTLNPPSRQGVPFGYNITATNSPTSFGEAGLPAGLSIDQSTGHISGTPTKAGTYQVTLKATNSGGSGTATVTLVVKSASPVD